MNKQKQLCSLIEETFPDELSAHTNEIKALLPVLNYVESDYEIIDEIDPSTIKLYPYQTILVEGKQQKKECPYCAKKVLHLGKHLRHHYMPKEERMSMCYAAKKRKPVVIGVKTRHCPFPECLNVPPFARLDKHLQSKHKLKQECEIYRKYIAKKSVTKMTSVRYSPFAESESQKFEFFLKTLDGGMLDIQNAKHHSYKIRQVLDGINFISISEFAAENCLDKIRVWFEKYFETRNPSSAITYLSVSIVFVKYLFDTNPELNANCLNRIVNRLNRYKRAFRKRASGILKFEKEIETEDILRFNNSSISHESMTIAESCTKEGYKITISDHSKFRNFLHLSLILRNACRSCVLSNLTVGEFETATQITDEFGEYKVAYVGRHKTVRDHGPANLVIPLNFYELLVIYKVNFRDKILAWHPDKKIDEFFITWSGNNLSSEDIYQGIHSIWKLAGNQSKIGTSILRKTVTTKVHSDRPNEKEGVARLLAHRLSTAETHYKFRTQASRAATASNVVFKTLTGVNDTTPVVSTMSRSTPLEDVSNMNEPLLDLPALNWVAGQSGKRSKGRAYFSLAERMKIKNHFKRYIKAKVVPSMNIIRVMITEPNFMSDFPHKEKLSPLKVKGCLQNFVNKEVK